MVEEQSDDTTGSGFSGDSILKGSQRIPNPAIASSFLLASLQDAICTLTRPVVSSLRSSTTGYILRTLQVRNSTCHSSTGIAGVLKTAQLQNLRFGLVEKHE